MLLLWLNTGALESRDTEGSVKGRAESTQGQIAESTTEQQNPEPQARNKADKDDSVDSFDYFARPQSQDIHTFFVIILNKSQMFLYQWFSIAKMEQTASG